MTWREFHLKKAGYERSQLEEWKKTRLIAYFSGVGQSIDHKTSIDKWLPLDGDKPINAVSSEAKDRFKALQKEYYKKVKNGE